MDEAGAMRGLDRSQVYRYLAIALGRPESEVVRLLREEEAAVARSLVALGENRGLEAANAAASALAGSGAASLADAYLGAFGHTISKECPPYEAEYRQAHIFQKSDTLADIAAFYRAFGVALAPDRCERLDHICAELEFMEFLCLKEAHALASGCSDEKRALGVDAQRKFLGEHLGNWALEFASRLRRRAEGNFYGDVAELLEAFVTGEMRSMGLPMPPPGAEGPDLAVDEAACASCLADDSAAGREGGVAS